MALFNDHLVAQLNDAQQTQYRMARQNDTLQNDDVQNDILQNATQHNAAIQTAHGSMTFFRMTHNRMTFSGTFDKLWHPNQKNHDTPL